MYTPTEVDTPFLRLGGEAPVRDIVTRFYDFMDDHEPELAKLHHCDPPGKVSPVARERFALFLIGWLGGPQDYVTATGTHDFACATARSR
ncbi:MAG: hypothetical protein U0165_20430 [Polyangiaceae bacterium]